ncbi:MAG: NADH:ubiquinone reductase (Na(+)-transporting) subunit C [Candidatus Omnitrophica bacterium]|nr:NADH:ubiquinone reductase (Na(+)-transporting) subunit C [Candidatus Omnitrophota bacterium]
MRLESNRYTFMFAFAVCVTCSLALSIVSEGLKEKKALNVALDIKKNILKAVSLETPLSAKVQAKEVLDLYDAKIEEKVINAEGQVVEGKRPVDIQEAEALYPLYMYKEGGQIRAYCFPIVGKGLWSTIYGYFALEPDAMTVRGITFYKHGETPGLGAEIEKDWFQDNYKGKKIWDIQRNRLIPVKVVKGQVNNVVSKEEMPFYVDGISGATMTSKGVTAMVDKWINIYEPFFNKIREDR